MVAAILLMSGLFFIGAVVSFSIGSSDRPSRPGEMIYNYFSPMIRNVLIYHVFMHRGLSCCVGGGRLEGSSWEGVTQQNTSVLSGERNIFDLRIALNAEGHLAAFVSLQSPTEEGGVDAATSAVDRLLAQRCGLSDLYRCRNAQEQHLQRARRRTVGTPSTLT